MGLEFLSQPVWLEPSALRNHSSLWKDLSSGIIVVAALLLLLLLLLLFTDGGKAEFGDIGGGHDLI